MNRRASATGRSPAPRGKWLQACRWFLRWRHDSDAVHVLHRKLPAVGAVFWNPPVLRPEFQREYLLEATIVYREQAIERED
jgi:hypothetical protein